MHDTDAPDRANVGGLRRRAESTDASAPRDSTARAATESYPLRFALAHTARER